MGLTRRTLLAAAAAGVTLGLAGRLGGARGERRGTLTRRVDGVAALAVENADGDVTVRTHDGDDVVVDVTGRGPSERAVDRLRVGTRREGGTLVVEAVAPERGGAGTVRLDVRVPAGLAVARVRTANGDATVRGTTGDVVVSATNGDATVDDVDGFATLRAVNGTATAAGAAGLDGASAVNGDVDVEVRAVRGDATVGTTNGDVRVAVARTLDGGASAGATDGSRRVVARSTGGPRLTVDPGNGRATVRSLDG